MPFGMRPSNARVCHFTTRAMVWASYIASVAGGARDVFALGEVASGTSSSAQKPPRRSVIGDADFRPANFADPMKSLFPISRIPV
jgi:hypothetical protein